MKNQKSYIISCIIGAAMIITGALLAIFYTVPQGIMQTLPFVLVGIGFGSFGGGLGGAVSIHMMKNDSNMAKQIQIEENDERNINIEHKAKAKTDSFMSVLLLELTIFLAMMQVKPLVVLVFVGAIFLRIFVLFYFLNKYRKEM